MRLTKHQRKWAKWDRIIGTKMLKELYRKAQGNGYPKGIRDYNALLLHRYNHQNEPVAEERW